MKAKPTILVIEDEPLSRKLLTDFLTLKGFEVIEAADGQTGVEKALERIPGLILLDIQLPVMDGYDVLKTLKEYVRTRAVPIWILTSYAMPGDEARMRANGCDDYFSKPLDMKELLSRIESHFAGLQHTHTPCEAPSERTPS